MVPPPGSAQRFQVSCPLCSPNLRLLNLSWLNQPFTFFVLPARSPPPYLIKYIMPLLFCSQVGCIISHLLWRLPSTPAASKRAFRGGGSLERFRSTWHYCQCRSFSAHKWGASSATFCGVFQVSPSTAAGWSAYKTKCTMRCMGLHRT